MLEKKDIRGEAKSKSLDEWSVKHHHRGRKFVKQKLLFLATLEKNDCNFEETCDELGVHQRMLDKQMKHDKRFAEEVEDIHKRVCRNISGKFISDLAEKYNPNAFKMAIQYGIINPGVGEEGKENMDKLTGLLESLKASSESEAGVVEMPGSNRQLDKA